MKSYADRIVDAMGGTSAVAQMSKTPTSTVHSWRKNGIPDARLDHLKLVADREGLSIDWTTGERLHERADAA